MLRIYNAIPRDAIRLIVFDLDGTLIDSTVDLCNSVNAMLREFHREELPLNQITGYIGDGAHMLVRRALFGAQEPPQHTPQEEHLFAAAMRFFLDYYRAHKLDFTRAYDGVLEALAALEHHPAGGRRKMAVLTNKPVGPARAICDALGMGRHLFRVYGGDSFPVKKPDPLGLRTLMDEAGAEPGETLMIGDSAVDVKTARNAGAWMLGCTFGLSPQPLAEAGPDLTVDRPIEWIEALNGAESHSGARTESQRVTQ
jgi:phosphoglycolate phosphatase